MLHNLVDLGKLHLPLRVVQKLPHVKPVVVCPIALTVVAGCQNCHFVAIDCIELEEFLYFLSYFRGSILRLPLSKQMLEHRKRAHPFDFAQLTVLVKLLVGHPHFILVKLRGVGASCCGGPQLCRWLGAGYFGKDRKLGLLRHVPEELLKVCFVDSANRINVRSRAVIFGHVAAEALRDIASSKDKEEALLVSGPRH